MFKKFFNWIKSIIKTYTHCADMCNHQQVMSELERDEKMKKIINNVSSKEALICKFHYNVFIKHSDKILLGICMMLLILLFITLNLV